ncbi:MAG: histidine kinase dimerization/phosphoacceptor domain-containing protein, partial [Acidobacteriota bacterium]
MTTEAAVAAGVTGRPASQLRADRNESRLAERVIAVARALLTMAAMLVFRLDPPEPSRYTTAVTGVLFAYLALAIIVLIYLLRAQHIPRGFPLFAQAADVGFAGFLTLSTAGPSSPAFTLLLYPLLAAAYRWGFREVMMTAIVVDVLMGIEAFVLGEARFELNMFALRTIYVVAMGAAVGFMAESEKRLRFESRGLSMVLAHAGHRGTLDETMALVLAAVRTIFGATTVMMVVQEQEAGSAWLWTTDAGPEDGHAPRAQPLGTALTDSYLFPGPGVAWHTVAMPWRGRGGRFSAVAVDARDERIQVPAMSIPDAFTAAHPCRSLLVVSAALSDEWTGRLLVVNPAPGVPREQSVRFGMRLAAQVSPAVYGQYLMRRLRTRAGALERARIARELHDGVTQSLIGLEMEIVVLHRRAVTQVPQMADDLARVHGIVRNEIITVRELMEGVRVGEVAAEDMLDHLREVVNRFGRYTGIAARF